MTDAADQDFVEFYRENLAGDIISALAEATGLSPRAAMDAYYRSELSGQVAEGRNGIDNLPPKALAEDLLENEREVVESARRARP